MSTRHLVAQILLWGGVGFLIVSCLGVVVARSAMDRLHFTSPALLGTLLIAVAVVVQESFSLIGNQALLAAVLMVIGAPIVTAATGRAIRIYERGEWTLSPQESEELEVGER